VANRLVAQNSTGFENQTGTLESLRNNLVRGNATNTVGTITIVAGQ
jgi:hypothetical protein